MKAKPYTAKTLAGAQCRVRQLEKIVASMNNGWADCECRENKANANCQLLARLAAKGPAFDNPLEAMAAGKIRDEVLCDIGLNPDGTKIGMGGGK
jgi:hypothetical protein